MDVLAELVGLVKRGEEGEALERAKQAMGAGLAPAEIIAALTVGMREVGEQFSRMEVFLPEMTMAARAMQAVMKEVEAELVKVGGLSEKKGRLVIGTVEGDMHAIGKDIVISLMRCHGFEVIDLGVNVNALEFVHRAEEAGADAIGASALMTTTMPGQREIVELLKAKGIREKYHVILGGAPVTSGWVEACGADSWAENAWQGVEIMERLSAGRRG